MRIVVSLSRIDKDQIKNKVQLGNYSTRVANMRSDILPKRTAIEILSLDVLQFFVNFYGMQLPVRS